MFIIVTTSGGFMVEIFIPQTKIFCKLLYYFFACLYQNVHCNHTVFPTLFGYSVPMQEHLNYRDVFLLQIILGY